jgi:hypothetical protein
MDSINGKVLTKSYRAWLGSDLGDPGVGGKIILRWIFRKWDMGLWTGSSWLRIGTAGGLL